MHCLLLLGIVMALIIDCSSKPANGNTGDFSLFLALYSTPLSLPFLTYLSPLSFSFPVSFDAVLSQQTEPCFHPV